MADKEINDLTSGGAAQAGDLIHVVRGGNSRKVEMEAQLPATRAGSAGPASLQLHEDTDNGTNKITIIAPAAIGADRIATLPDKTGTLAMLDDIVLGMSTQERRNSLLRAAGIAKALLGYQRDLDTVACGYKAAGDADASSTGGAVDTAVGAWKPGPGGIDAQAGTVMHFDGSNGSTTMTDSAISPRTWTPAGNAQIATDQSKFGGSSLKLDGTGDWLLGDANTAFAFGTGDFTIDFWLRCTSLSSYILDMRPTATSGLYPSINMASGIVTFFTNNANRLSSSTALTSGAWNHIALVRASGVTRLYINGVSEGGTYADTNNYLCGASRPSLGASGFDLGSNLNGWIDEFRVSKGIARWTANFTPPATAYSTGTQNATLITPFQTADAARTKARAVIEIDAVDVITLGTDWTVELTCNGGTNWHAASTHTNCGIGQDGRTIIETDLVSCTSGSSFATRIKNLNNKMVHVYKAIVEAKP